MYDSSDELKKKDNESTIVPVKKKRGRKPKKKDTTKVVVKEKKKRGRKPKKKDSVNVVKEKKKRGRKPASEIVSLVDNNSTNTVKEDDCIITHFPISINDINVNNSVDVNNSVEVNNLVEVNNSVEETEDVKSVVSDNCDSIFIKASVKESENENENENDLIKKYEKKIKELNEKIISLNPNSGLKTKKVVKTNLKFNYIDNSDKKWIENTDIHCWWCCHSFDTPPVSLPEKIYQDTYHVFGCFCSFNCAASYNINMNDYKIWERLSLLKSMYMKIYDKDIDIIPAPPRKTLKMFGGYLDIQQFRSNILNLQKEYIYLIPPMISMTPLIEETSRSLNSDNNEKFVPIYSSNNIKSSDKLMRKKPINNAKYSLVKTMGLRKKSAKKEEENDFFI